MLVSSSIPSLFNLFNDGAVVLVLASSMPYLTIRLVVILVRPENLADLQGPLGSVSLDLSTQEVAGISKVSCIKRCHQDGLHALLHVVLAFGSDEDVVHIYQDVDVVILHVLDEQASVCL